MVKKKKMPSKVTAVVLALMMAVVFMPTFAFAADGDGESTAAEPITVYMTVSDQGEIAMTKDGEAMAWKEVKVADLNNDNSYTFDEALVAAHDTYYEGGAEAGYKTGVEKLWGHESQNFLFFVNGKGIPTGVAGVNLEGGEYLTAAYLTDTDMGLDWVSCFSENVLKVEKGDEINLNLKGHLGMALAEEDKEDAPLSDVQIGVWDGEFKALDSAKTNEDGDVSVSFDEPGTYIVTAAPDTTNRTTVKSRESSGLWYPFSSTAVYDNDDNEIWGKWNWSTYEAFGGYTEKDYGDGPYPYEELKWVKVFDYNDFDFEPSEEDLAKGYFMHTGDVLYDCPIIAPCCIVKVLDTADVKMTVNNKGEFAKTADGEDMVQQDVTVTDLDGDGEFTLDEALVAAHEAFCPDGAEGYALGTLWGSTAVTKLWGTETTNNLFFVENESISPDTVDTKKIDSGDDIYASINADYTYYADFMTYFDSNDLHGFTNLETTLTLYGFKGMGYGDELIPQPLEGIQLGYWEDGQFVPIEGAVTDEDGEATFLPKKEGDFLITAQGTVEAELATEYDPVTYEATKYETVDCPIMAPFCVLTVEPGPGAALDDVKAAALNDLLADYNFANYRMKEQIQVLGALISAQAKILSATSAEAVSEAKAEADTALSSITTDAQYKAQEDAVKAVKVAKVKAKAGKKKITVTWKADKANFDGYQVSYALKGKKAKTVTIAKAATAKKVIKKLKKGKKYTVKVRGYKTIDGTKIYGPWASAKTVKVK